MASSLMMQHGPKACSSMVQHALVQGVIASSSMIQEPVHGPKASSSMMQHGPKASSSMVKHGPKASSSMVQHALVQGVKVNSSMMQERIHGPKASSSMVQHGPKANSSIMKHRPKTNSSIMQHTLVQRGQDQFFNDTETSTWAQDQFLNVAAWTYCQFFNGTTCA
jgi:hypothetical protein